MTKRMILCDLKGLETAKNIAAPREVVGETAGVFAGVGAAIADPTITLSMRLLRTVQTQWKYNALFLHLEASLTTIKVKLSKRP